MKNKCVICSKAKGRRTCRVRQHAVICSQCCASIRNQDCEGCTYYTFAQQYQSAKYSQSESKHFIIEINEEVEQSVDHALELLNNKAFKEGKRIIHELLNKHPRNHWVQFAMGVYYVFKEEYQQAIEYFDKAIEIFPYFVEAYFNKAAACQKQLDIKNMVKAFQKVIEIGNPKDELVNQAKDSLADLDRHIREYEGVSLETYFKGMELFEQAVKYMTKRDWKQAIFYFQKCLTVNPRHPQSYGNMGICYAQLGKKDLAFEVLDKALEIDPQYELAIVNRALVESLKEGEILRADNINSVEYYKEYPLKKKSYLKQFMQQLHSSIRNIE
ncbi:MAG: tetratricopeptide repeat protein [Bacillota bacterium]